ncbi:hypothetical protein J4234_03780 [Candidatus Woesearchaeota archaeon]|nr:hypothetical protein [Candidatus Woesearchaeota archaeon]
MNIENVVSDAVKYVMIPTTAIGAGTAALMLVSYYISTPKRVLRDIKSERPPFDDSQLCFAFEGDKKFQRRYAQFLYDNNALNQ